jgi:hypothetical protein
VHLYAERGSPKYEKAAMRWLERYLTEGSPRLEHFAEVVSDLPRRDDPWGQDERVERLLDSAHRRQREESCATDCR